MRTGQEGQRPKVWVCFPFLLWFFLLLWSHMFQSSLWLAGCPQDKDLKNSLSRTKTLAILGDFRFYFSVSSPYKLGFFLLVWGCFGSPLSTPITWKTWVSDLPNSKVWQEGVYLFSALKHLLPPAMFRLYKVNILWIKMTFIPSAVEDTVRKLSHPKEMCYFWEQKILLWEQKSL